MYLISGFSSMSDLDRKSKTLVGETFLKRLKNGSKKVIYVLRYITEAGRVT